ncbi:MAG: redoxin domain-containing protein [Pseudomonadota bacterium]
MLLKSLFISSYISLLTLASGHAAWMLTSDSSNLAWWGALVATLPSLAFFIRLFLAPVARMNAVMWPLIAANIIATGLLLRADSASAWPWVYVLGVGWVGNLAYQLWYSRFGRQASHALKLGQQLPVLTLQNSDGSSLSTASLQGPLLIIFYRGNWCPLCMAQIREVAEQYQALAALGVQTLLVSPQPHSNTADLAERFNVPFHFLVDKNNAVARALGIIAESGTPMGLQALGYDSDTVMPTVIMTDAQQKIIFCDETDNYRVRPEPEVFLKILRGEAI